MPTAPADLRKKWTSLESARDHLKGKGWTLNRDWTWTPPKKEAVKDQEALSAVWYLHLEWDFGGVRFDFTITNPAQGLNR